MPARAHIARARLGLVLRRCPAILPQHMQGGSRCPGRAVEPERARWHDPVLGRWLGLTPEQPALCLRGFPGRLRVALSRVSDPPGLGRRQGAHRAARGTIREKRYNLSHPGVHHTFRIYSCGARRRKGPPPLATRFASSPFKTSILFAELSRVGDTEFTKWLVAASSARSKCVFTRSAKNVAETTS